MILIVSFLVVVVVFFGWFYRHQVLLRDRAHLMREAIRNEEFTFRLPVKGLFFGERALQEALNETGKDIGVLLARNEVESWQRLTRVLTHEIMNATTPIASISQAYLDNPAIAGTVYEEGVRAIHETSRGLALFVDSYRKLAGAGSCGDPIGRFRGKNSDALSGFGVAYFHPFGCHDVYG